MSRRSATSLFFAYCPDYTVAGTLERRLAARPAHFAQFAIDKEAGRAEFGRGYLPPPDSPLHASPSLNGIQAMAGSVLFLRYPTLADAWARIKADPYWIQGVWDQDKVVIEEFIDMAVSAPKNVEQADATKA